jgi:hypothetical protein
MEIGKAIEILEEISIDQGEPMLETLQYMRDNLHAFTEQQQQAFRKFMMDGARMFA